MGAGVHELKHAARLQEWSVKVAECRSSGMGVKAWCREHGIALKTYYNWERQIVKAATSGCELQSTEPRGLLVQVNPENMPSGGEACPCAEITIRHGETVLILPAGSSTDMIAELVKALNRHV